MSYKKTIPMIFFILFVIAPCAPLNVPLNGSPGPPICPVEGTEKGVDLLVKIEHGKFMVDEVVGGMTYKVHLTKTTPTPLQLAIKTTPPSQLGPTKPTPCDTFRVNMTSSDLWLDWSIPDSNEANITLSVSYNKANTSTTYHAAFDYPSSSECDLHLHPETSTLSTSDLPKKDCKVWFPSSTNNGIVVDLLKLNVPCSKGYIHLDSKQKKGHKLCGKLEELPSAERTLHFSNGTAPYILIKATPTFQLRYHLVDYCYNITLNQRHGSIYLKPFETLNCTFRIYIPWGNRVALTLTYGLVDNTPSTTPLITLNQSCAGLLVTVLEGRGLAQCFVGHAQQVRYTSRGNKLILTVSGKSAPLPLTINYQADIIADIVGMCEFGWVALRQFCVRVEGVKLPWAKAEEECVKRGGHLVSVRSEQDQKIIDKLLQNSPNHRDSHAYWIGASDRTHESDFRWSDGLSFSYTNWFPGWPQHHRYNKQPNDDGLSDQDCVEVRRSFSLPSSSTQLSSSFMWNDRDCATPNLFICEKLQNDEPLEEPWPSDCNRTVILSGQNSRTSVSSPGFPRHYPDNADCDVTIQAPSGYRIVLDFDELVMENEPSYDFLEIIEAGNSSASNITSPGRRLCGDWSAKLKLLRYISFTSKLLLRFSSDYSHHFGGFKTSVSMESAMQCGDERLRMFNNACYLVANYPEVTWQTAQQICKEMKFQLASITTPEEGRFIIETIRKNSDYRTSALYWLGARSNMSQFKWIDGASMEYEAWHPHHLPKHLNDDCLAVQWMSSTPSGLYWKALQCNRGGGYVCKRRHLDRGQNINRTFTGPQGSVTTPNYPDVYENNLDFSVTIIGPDRTRLKIDFDKLDIEWQMECLYDYVEVDGVRMCGITSPRPFVSITNKAQVRFHSDYSIGGTGFSLHWTAVDVSACPTQTLTAHDGTVTSPNYPHFLLPFLDCTVNIQAPMGKRAWLQFDDVDIDGDAQFELVVGRGRGFRPYLDTELLTEGCYVSIEETLTIKLKTGDNPRGRGFRALYRMTDEFVTQERTISLTNTSYGTIHHLNYPLHPPPHLDFLQLVVAPPGHTISIQLYQLKLSLGCSHFIEIYDHYADVNGTTWRLCGRGRQDEDTPVYVKSYLNTLQLRQRGFTTLNGTLRVMEDEQWHAKLVEYGGIGGVERCNPNPCLNGGKCVHKNDKKVCQCSGHFTGLFCAITQCDLEPCVFGLCQLTNTSYKCQCKPNYMGPICDQRRKPCEGNPCESRGTCVERGSGFICRCHAWWEGARCDKRMLHIPFKPLSERMLHEPFWLGLMTVFVVMGVIGLVWCAKRHFPEKLEKLLAEDDNSSRIHSLRSTSVREQLAAASNATSSSLVAPSPSVPGSGSGPSRSLFGRLGIRKPSLLSLTSPHCGLLGGSSPAATARTFSLDDLLKPLPRRSPSPKKKRNNSTPTKKNVAEKKQILQQLISPVNKHNSKRVSLGELIQMTEHKSGIQSAPSVIIHETKFSNDPALAALNDPKLEKKVTFARLLNKVSAEMSSGSDMEMGIMQANRLGCIFPRPSSTPPSPSVVNRSPNSTSSNQGSGSFSSDLAIPSMLGGSITELRRTNTCKPSMGRQKPASADSILAMFKNFSASSASANLSSLKISPSTTPTSPHDDMVGDDESSSSSIHTPISYCSTAPESPILHHYQSTIEVSVLDPRQSGNSGNLLHPPTILLEIPAPMNKCLSPIREMPTPLPSPIPSPRRSPSPLGRRMVDNNSSLDEISLDIPNISISGSDDDRFEERTKSRPPPLGYITTPVITIQTPSPTLLVPGSPPPNRAHPTDSGCVFQFPPPCKGGGRKLRDFDKPTSLDLPCVPPVITITSNLSEAESDFETTPKLGVPQMTYLSPFSMPQRAEQHASESNLSSSGYSSMASPGPSRCGSSNPLCGENENPLLRPGPSTSQQKQRGRSDSETLSDDPLLESMESNDEGIGTDHIDEKIDDGELKSAKELETFLEVATSKNSLQLPSIVVQMDSLSPDMSSRSESPLSDKTRFSPLFYGKNKDILPFTDSDGLYDFPSTDKISLCNSITHKKTGRKRERRKAKTPSPTKLELPNCKENFYKVPPPRKLSPKRRLARTQVVSSSSSSDSIASARELRLSSSSEWTWTEKLHKSLDDKEETTPSTPMLSRSLDFSRKQPKKLSRLKAISNQIRFLRRLEMSLKRRSTSPVHSADSFDSDEDQSASPLLRHQKSNSAILLPRGRAKWSSLQERRWPNNELMVRRDGNSE